MNNYISLIYVVSGFLVRIAIPLAVTFVLARAIRRLDQRWQAEGARRKKNSVPACWEYMNCSKSRREQCPVHNLPGIICWEYFRSNGSVQPRCENCAYRHTFVAASESLAQL